MPFMQAFHILSNICKAKNGKRLGLLEGVVLESVVQNLQTLPLCLESLLGKSETVRQK